MARIPGNVFKRGDRVVHKLYGEGAVIRVCFLTNLTDVKFDQPFEHYGRLTDLLECLQFRDLRPIGYVEHPYLV